jgi:hypothetical protein
VLFLVVFVVDQKDCFILVINDSMADECNEIEVVDAIIWGLADCLHVIYFFFDIEVNV